MHIDKFVYFRLVWLHSHSTSLCPSPRPLSVPYFSCVFGFCPILFSFRSMCYSSLPITCPYRFNRLALIVLKSAPNTLSRWCVTPHVHCSILISSTPIGVSCRFVVARVSGPYNIAALITVLLYHPIQSTAAALVATLYSARMIDVTFCCCTTWHLYWRLTVANVLHVKSLMTFPNVYNLKTQ